MKDMITIIKKELYRVFKDPKLVLTMFILPGLMIFGLYALMGNAMDSLMTGSEEKELTIYYVNEKPAHEITIGGVKITFEGLIQEEKYGLSEVNWKNINSDEIDDYKKKIYDGDVPFVVEFDPKFDEKVANEKKPNITLYYNPSKTDSENLYNKFSSLLNDFNSYLLTEKNIDVNMFSTNVSPQFEEKKLAGKMMAMFLPFLIVSFLFSGAVSIAPESIAGEKERNTMVTLLVTPVNRTHIALGKIISLSIVATLSALSSFIGVMASMPLLLKSATDAGLNLDIYGFGEYAAVLLILLSVVIVLVGALSICSAFAKNVKEASMLMTPLMIISMGVSMLSMFTEVAPTTWYLYLIPIYNSVLMLQQVFSFTFNYSLLAITLCSDIVYAIIFTFILTRMFNSEKIMFSK